MCVNIEVILPTIENFLLLFSLRCGSVVVFAWTLARSLFCVAFFSTAILEVLVGKQFPSAPLLVQKKPDTKDVYIVYYSFLTLLLAETILLVFAIHLGVGIYRCTVHLLEHYLVCRLVTWLAEVVALFILCLVHKLLIGWYLGILFFVILEFYSYVVVYSYYASLSQESEKDENDE